MSMQELIKQLVFCFFVITSLVNVAIYVLGSMFMPDAALGYDAFLSPLIFGFFSLFPVLIMYSKRELSVKELVIRKVLQLVLLEILLYFVAFGSTKQDVRVIIAFEASVAIICVLVNIILWMLNSHQAMELSKELEEFQKSQDA